jgi:hypothetical protein
MIAIRREHKRCEIPEYMPIEKYSVVKLGPSSRIQPTMTVRIVTQSMYISLCVQELSGSSPRFEGLTDAEGEPALHLIYREVILF